MQNPIGEADSHGFCIVTVRVLNSYYIFRNMSRMNIMDPDVFYDKYIAEDFETKYVAKSFERICKQ